MYGKLFAQMYDGTLATKGPWQALVTFQQLVILADKTGIVDMTTEAIARRTTIPLDIIRIGITALEQPDSESRSPALGGRRITRLSDDREWGWQIVNYEHYRNMRSADERREYMRQYMRKKRANGHDSVNKFVSNVSEVSQSSKQYAVSSKQVKDTSVDRGPGEGVRKPEKRATRLPADWSLPDEWKDWAVRVHHLDPQRTVRISLAFRDYWIAKAGKDATKADWFATWRNWIRRDAES